MSTTRYLLAGAPGAGAVTNNMMSRVIAWMNFAGDYQGTPVGRNGLNISGITDIAVGRYTANFVALLANDVPVVLNNHTRTLSWVNSASDCYDYKYNKVYLQTMENGTNIDPGTMMVHVTGNLA